jgi:hypothetical protein
MSNRLLYIPFFFFVQFANAQSALFNCPKDIKRQYASNAQLQLHNAFIIKGQTTVLRYSQVFDCSESHHWGIGAIAFVQMPDSGNSFKYDFTSSDTVHKNLEFFTRCGASSKCVFRIISAEGKLSGNFLEGKWVVNGSLKINMINGFKERETLTLDLSGAYTKWKQPRKLRKYHSFSGFN